MTTVLRSRDRRDCAGLYPGSAVPADGAGEPQYPEFAAKIRPTEFAPGVIKGTGSMAAGRLDGPMGRGARADAAQPDPAQRARRRQAAARRTFRFHIAQYLTRRATDWADRGYRKRLTDWPALNARSKFWGDDQRAAFKNWEEIDNLHSPPKGIAENIQRREFLRRVLVKVIHENKLDVLIQLHTALPPGKIGLAPEPGLNNRAISYPLGPSGRHHRDPHPGGLRADCVRSDVRAGHRWQRTQVLPQPDQDDADDAPRAGGAVFHQFPGGARDGASDHQGGVSLSGRIKAARAAAGLRPASRRAVSHKLRPWAPEQVGDDRVTACRPEAVCRDELPNRAGVLDVTVIQSRTARLRI